MDRDRFGRRFDRSVQVIIAALTGYGVYLQTQSGGSASPARSTGTSVSSLIRDGGIMKFAHSPLTLIIGGLILAIINYVLRRKSARIVPIVGLTFRGSWMEFDPTQIRPRKLRLQFSNDSQEDIHLENARWIKDRIGTQAGKPIVNISFRIKSDEWDWGLTERTVAPGQWFRIWVGLDSSVPESELEKLTERDRLGILEIPAVISGTAIKVLHSAYYPPRK
jgi:hypothetical protein